MSTFLKRYFYLLLGGIFFLLGLIGVLLPVLPTTPFMILAMGCFAKSSPRFHQALLNNRWIGKDLQRWEQSHTMLRSTKKRATWVILASFSLSISLVWQQDYLPLMLLVIAGLLLFFLWRVAEVAPVISQSD
ncbi:MAG: DUF454 domain-containing protein [Gammaproteobacteria bacterium]|nr:DUF454 domain-containing protein [Gammaproteobacteria bacterium]